MPPKKKAAAPAEPPRVPRDLAEVNPLDGREGALGVENLDVQERVKELQEELVLFKISEAITTGALDLDLRDCGLEHLPDGVFDLPGLQVLDAARNLLPNAVFEDLKDVEDLRAVNLCSNQLAAVLPESLGSLAPSLEELCLDENVITGLPSSAASLANLSWVSLRRNVFTSFPGGLLAAWRNLVHLDLRDNKLTSLPEELGECGLLQELLVTGNELQALPEGIRGCTSLTVLLANRNQLGSVTLGLQGCVNLQHLDLTANKLVDVPGAVLGSLTRLRQLFLGLNKIAELPPEIGACTELEVLSLSTNALKGLPEDVGKLTHLREIYCGNNPMSSLPPTVTGWTQLQQGVFRNCKLKTLPPGVEESWSGVKLLDVRAKGKKDTCKVSTEVQEVLKKTRMVGVVWTKPKKKKAGKK